MSDQFLLRGATEAQKLAEVLCGRPAPGAGTEEAGNPTFYQALPEGTREDLIKTIGFGSVEQGRVALTAVIWNDVIRRMRIYAHATVRLEVEEAEEDEERGRSRN